MKVLEDSTKKQALDPRHQVSWGSRVHGLLVAAAIVYATGAVLFMAAPMSGVLAWWLLGTVAGLVALGFLASAAPATGSTIAALRHFRRARDVWAELWEERMRRPVR